MKDVVIWRESDVAKVLHTRYAAPEWAFLTGVRNRTGFDSNIRTADAIAMNLYPSRGMEVNGFEIKVSRSDVMHELMQPEKSAEIQQFCHRWWLVISDPKLIADLNIPITWGVIDVSTGKCKVLKKAPDLKAKPMTREFVASLFRKVTEGFVHPEEVKEIAERARKNAVYSMNEAYKTYKKLRDDVDAFERESGLKISEGWGDRGEKVGKAVKFILQSRENMEWKVKTALNSAKSIVKEFENVLKHAL